METMSMVIDHGALVNAAGLNGDTAVYLICEYGFLQAFRFLLAAGTKPPTTHPATNQGSGVWISFDFSATKGPPIILRDAKAV